MNAPSNDERTQSPDDREKSLRKQLGVPDDVSVGDVLKMIYDRGCTPRPFRVEVDGETLYACPVTFGIFTSCQIDERGQSGQEGCATPMLAALDGLRRASEWNSIGGHGEDSATQ